MTTERANQQIYFEDVNVGDEIPRLVRGPMSPIHLFRWSAAIENWHRIHYDEVFTKEIDKHPERLVNGTWKQHVMVQVLKDWAGLGGWVWKTRFSFRAMDQVWDTLVAWGTVTGKRQLGDYGIVELDIGMYNETRDHESTPGSATVVLPLRDGPPIPYPFVPPEE